MIYTMYNNTSPYEERKIRQRQIDLLNVATGGDMVFEPMLKHLKKEQRNQLSPQRFVEHLIKI